MQLKKSSAEITIKQDDGKIFVRAQRRYGAGDKVEIFFWMLFASGGVIAYGRRFESVLLVVGMAILVVILQGLYFLRDYVTELRVTNSEVSILSRGRLGITSQHSIPRSDIQILEYQNAVGGSDTESTPKGLYACMRSLIGWRRVCLLPYLDEQQSADVVRQLLIKFPELATQMEKR